MNRLLPAAARVPGAVESMATIDETRAGMHADALVRAGNAHAEVHPRSLLGGGSAGR